MSSARERPTRDVMVRSGVSCLRESVKLGVVVAAEGGCVRDKDGIFDLTTSESSICSVDEVGAVEIGGCGVVVSVVLVSIASVDACDDGILVSRLPVRASSTVEWEPDSGVGSHTGMEILESDSSSLLSSFAATASRMNPSHTRARYSRESCLSRESPRVVDH